MMRRTLAVLMALASPLAAQSKSPAGPSALAWAAADAHADAAPPAAEQSVAALAAYLAQAGSADSTRARALFRWVTGHIDYDVQGFRTGNYGDLTPDGVLRRRTGVCQGYAGLVEALGTAMGLRVMVVAGWSKGYGYRPGQALGRTNHAWNAVQIDGRWRLMDPTWGAGSLDERLQFVRRFQEHYFLTAPDAFVFDHLPEDPRWQLLERPIDHATYAGLAYLRPMFFLAGFRIGSHIHSRISAGERLLVTLGTTRPVDLSAVVVDAASGRNLEGSWAMAQLNGDSAEIRAAFPRPGQYLLRVFARPRGSDIPSAWVLDYGVDAGGGVEAGFPTLYSPFAEHGAYLIEPHTAVLPAGQPQRIRLRVPGAVAVAAVIGNAWTHFTRAGDEFTAEVLPAPGPFNVFAKFSADGQYTGLLRYTGR